RYSARLRQGPWACARSGEFSPPIVKADRDATSADDTWAQNSIETGLFSGSARVAGKETWPFTPSKSAAGFESPVSAPGCPSVTPPVYVPGFAAISSAAVVPDASPTRQ